MGYPRIPFYLRNHSWAWTWDVSLWKFYGDICDEPTRRTLWFTADMMMGRQKPTYNCGATPMVWKAVFKKKRDIQWYTWMHSYLWLSWYGILFFDYFRNNNYLESAPEDLKDFPYEFLVVDLLYHDDRGSTKPSGSAKGDEDIGSNLLISGFAFRRFCSIGYTDILLVRYFPGICRANELTFSWVAKVRGRNNVGLTVPWDMFTNFNHSSCDRWVVVELRCRQRIPSLRSALRI